MRALLAAVPIALIAALAPGRSGGGDVLEFDAFTRPSMTVDVGSQIDGVLHAVHARRGATVAKGDVLAELEQSVERVNTELARAKSEQTAALGTAEATAAHNKKRLAQHQSLYDREMVTPVYQPRLRPMRLDGRVETTVLFIVDRAHPQYAGRLTPARAAEVVLRGQGASGANPDYLASMVAHLDELGLHDAFLRETQALVRANGG